MKALRTLCSLMILTLLLAFAAGAETVPAADPTPETKDSLPAAKAPADPETVLATVEGKEIKLKDVKEILGRLDPQRAVMYDSEPGRRAILEEMVNMELFLLLGEELEVEKDPAFVAMMEGMKKDVIRRFAIDHIMKDVKVSPEEVAEFYEAHKDQFKIPESVKASHILVENEEAMSKVKEDIKAGMSFEDAAKAHSTCPSKDQGGNLGFFSRGQMVKEFEDAVFAMNVGDVTEEPVKTQFGLHLIKLVEKKDASVRPLDEVKDELTETLDNDKKAKAYNDQLLALREKYKVVIAGEEDKEGDPQKKAGSDEKNPE